MGSRHFALLRPDSISTRRLAAQACPDDKPVATFFAIRFATAIAFSSLLAGCGYERWFADREIDRLCKIDGGIKVYIKDLPPKEFMRPDGKINSWTLGAAKPGQSYYFVNKSKQIRTGEQEIVRIESDLIRGHDKALLGTGIAYLRPRDSLGPFSIFPITHSCPELGADGPLISAVFGVEHASF